MFLGEQWRKLSQGTIIFSNEKKVEVFPRGSTLFLKEQGLSCYGGATMFSGEK